MTTLFCQNNIVQEGLIYLFFDSKARDIHIECSKQFKWTLYFYVSGKSQLFWAVLYVTALKFKYEL